MRKICLTLVLLASCSQQVPEETGREAEFLQRGNGPLYTSVHQVEAGRIFTAEEYLHAHGTPEPSESLLAELSQGEVRGLGSDVTRPVRLHSNLVMMPAGTNEDIEAYADQFGEVGMARQLRWFEALVYFRAFDPTNRVHAFLHSAYLRDGNLLGTQAFTLRANQAEVGRCHQCLVACTFVVSPDSITDDQPSAGYRSVGQACSGTGYAYYRERRSGAGCGGMGVARPGALFATAGSSCRRSVSPTIRCAFAEDGAGACGQVAVQVGGTSFARSFMENKSSITTLPLTGSQNANSNSKVTLRLPDFSGGSNFTQIDTSKSGIGGSALNCEESPPSVSCSLTFGVGPSGANLVPGCRIGLGLACEFEYGRLTSTGVTFSRFSGSYNTVATFNSFTMGQPLQNLGTPEVKTEHSAYAQRNTNNGLGRGRASAFGEITLEMSRGHVLENPQGVQVIGPEIGQMPTVRVTCGSPINQKVEFPEAGAPPEFPADMQTACKSDLDCDDDRECTVDSCDMASCACVNDDSNCDQQPCQTDDECDAGETCMAGACTPPECLEDLDCGEDMRCIEGRCYFGDAVECNDQNPCPEGLDCVAEVCTPPECSDENPCENGEDCVDGRCEIEAAGECGDGRPDCPAEMPCCMAGACVPLENGMDACP